MKASQIRLKLLLEGLGIEFKLETHDDMKVIQKAAYLASEAGSDIGYTYGWYRSGPYSPELSKAAFKLKEDLWLEDKEYEEHMLVRPLADPLILLKGLMTSPLSELSQADWLALVASVLYLEHHREDSWSLADEEVKEPLRRYVGDAKEALIKYGLLKQSEEVK